MNLDDFFSRYDGFLIDVDGVLVRGSRALAGAAVALETLRSHGTIHLLTNNSSRSRSATAAYLETLGFQIDPTEITTSSAAAAAYLLKAHGPVEYWAVGEAGLHEELEAVAHRKAETPDAASWVVAGIDRHLTYETLRNALQALRAGAKLLATNTDPTFPVPDGFVPGAGAMVGALEGMGYRPDVVIGKPSHIAFETALLRMGIDPTRTLMVGDRLETDIAGAHGAGLDTALVLSGVASRRDMESSDVQPTWTFEDLAALARGP